jgi:heme/copper-type cytochrome/quinol oxidase subunit 4
MEAQNGMWLFAFTLVVCITIVVVAGIYFVIHKDKEY